MNEEKAMEVFEKAPVFAAVLKNAVPAMAAMLMVLVYNLADTFFIGQTHDDLQVAAVSLATPVFLIFMSVGTVFGIGGTSVISRAMGEGRPEYAKRVCSFCMWSCVAVGLVMSALFLIFMDQILWLVGASADTWHFARTDLTIVSLSGPFVLIANCYSNVIRAEGRSGTAMMGQLLGNLLNVVLDPIMILAFGWEIAGAAIATVIGNVVGAGYYILYFLRGKSTLSIHPRDFQAGEKVCTGVLAIGIPASLGSLLMSVSQIVVNARMTAYGDMAVAGIGVAMKVTMMTGMICIGFGQGIQPLIGYCVGAGLWERLKASMRFSHRPGGVWIRGGFCPHPADHQLPFRRVLCAGQCLTGHGRRYGGFGRQSQPAGHHLHSYAVFAGGTAGYEWPFVGPAGGGHTVHRFGGRAVYPHQPPDDGGPGNIQKGRRCLPFPYSENLALSRSICF